MKKLSLFLLTLACVFQFSAQAQERPSYIAIEANSGKLLFSSNAEEKRPVASLSQVATAMVALDWVARTRLPLDTFIAVPQEAFGLRAGNPMDLQPGDRLTLRDALYSTLLGSDNVSALTVASFVGRDLVSRRGGGAPIAAFVAEMNNLARSLRMAKTRFTAPHGLDAGNSVSTSCALDMALLGVYSMQNPAFCYIVSQASRRIEVQSQTKGRTMYDISNNNRLMSASAVDGHRVDCANRIQCARLRGYGGQCRACQRLGASGTSIPTRHCTSDRADSAGTCAADFGNRLCYAAS